MEYSYMGIFSEVFNWVLNKIISPVFNFVAGLLNTVLSWLFNTILAPILKDVFWPLIKLALDLIVKLLAGVIYGIFAKLLTFVDYTNKMFDYMIGLQKITYIPNGKNEELTLLELFMMRLPGISKVFWAIGFIGLALAFVFTVYAVAKSTLDFDFENRRPVSKVLGTFFKCLIQLFTVQFFVYFVVKASGVILSSVNAALALMGNDSAKATMGSIIFCASSMNAAIKPRIIMSSQLGKASRSESRMLSEVSFICASPSMRRSTR